jgi:hypothetical protein
MLKRSDNQHRIVSSVLVMLMCSDQIGSFDQTTLPASKIHLAFSTNIEERERRRQGIRTKLQEQEDYRVEKIQKFCDG